MEKISDGASTKKLENFVTDDFPTILFYFDCYASAASMTHFANLVFWFVGKCSRNSYVSGGLTNEHNMSVQSASYLGIWVSVIYSFFVLALLLLKNRLQRYEIRTKSFCVAEKKFCF